uniref:Chromosome 9 open reading frame 50 n=1 Tax=Cercocebus atys TaxID=9531 RepID=A0A2K5MTP4_CERAT
MFRRRARPGAQEVAPKGLPGDGDFRRSSDPGLPKLTPPALRAALGARGSGGSRIPGGGAAWWPEGDAEPEVGFGRLPPPRLPALLTASRRAVRKRGLLRSLLLPPLLSAGASRESAPRKPGPGERERPRRGVAREDPDFLGAFLGELLPSRFREFLHQLQQKCAEEPEPLTSPAPQHQSDVLEHCPGSPQCPNCSFLPDLWGQSSHLQDSLTKISLHQTPTLGSLKGHHSQFTTVKKANHRPHGAQVPKLKAALTHSPSGEGSKPRKRRCPFRVRFADETLQDTTLRYWERRCSVQQSIIVNQKAALPVASERVFGSVGKRLESLPKALYPEAKEETLASSWCWDCAGLSTQKTQGCLSEDTSINSSVPFCSGKKAAAQRPRSGLRAFLDPYGNLEQLQSVLKQGRPKGYHLLLASTTLQPDQR